MSAKKAKTAEEEKPVSTKPKHTLKITYTEDENGKPELNVTHRCSVGVTAINQDVSFAETVELTDKKAAIAAIKSLLDVNRETMEKTTQERSVEHANAVLGIERKGKKVIKLGGSLGAIGNSATSKK